MSRPVQRRAPSGDISRHQSVASSVAPKNRPYNSVDMNKLYEAVLKVVILEYRNEARFRTPRPVVRPEDPSNGSAAASRLNRNSRVMDTSLPPNLLSKLESKLTDIMYGRSNEVFDQKTKRSLMSFLTLLLEPRFYQAMGREQLEFLVMKFISCANKELVNLHEPQESISSESFRLATTFLNILIGLVDKDNLALIKHLEEHRDSLAAKSASTRTVTQTSDNVEYLQPCFRISDMDKSAIALVQKLFEVDDIKIQTDVVTLSPYAQCSTVQKDVQQFRFQLDRGLNSNEFELPEAYHEWKRREYVYCDNLSSKYTVFNTGKSNCPDLPRGEEFYMIPSRADARTFFVALIQRYLHIFPFVSGDLLLTSQFQKHLHILSRVWLLDNPTTSVALFTGALRSGVMEKEKGTVQPYFINLEAVYEVFKLSDIFLTQGNNFVEPENWQIVDQKEWVGGLVACYKLTLRGIKECLLQIFNKENKPKFEAYLVFLDSCIYEDPLFAQAHIAHVIKSCNEKLFTALSKAATVKYAEYMKRLPRDASLNFSDVADIADNLCRDLAKLEKKFKVPLLDFLDIPYVVASTQNKLFKKDLKTTMRHIQALHENKTTLIFYKDAIALYMALRSYQRQFRPYGPESQILSPDLEAILLEHLKQMAEESKDKFDTIVNNLINSENSNPNARGEDISNLFSIINTYLTMLKNLDLPMLRMALIYTIVFRNISHSVLRYSSAIERNIIFILNEEIQAELINADLDARRQGGNRWLDVRNAFSNMQIGTSTTEVVEPIQFSPEICEGLNEFSTIMKQLENLENILNFESVSRTLATIDPASSKRYTSHLYSIRIIRAENLKRTTTTILPYATLKLGREIVGETRALMGTYDPEWDEEFDLNVPPNKSVVVTIEVWDRRVGGSESIGNSKLELSPLLFKEDGIAQEAIIDLNDQSRILVEIAVERERDDVMFLMGKAHRDILRCQDRCIKLIVERFSRFIHFGFSRANLKSICGNNGTTEPDDADIAIIPLCDYLNANLSVLKSNLSEKLFSKVMLQTWNVVLQSADELMLPKLVSSKSIRASLKNPMGPSTWLNFTTTVVNTMTRDRQLTYVEIVTVSHWLNALLTFFYNKGNGPSMSELKTEQYLALSFGRLYYEHTVPQLETMLNDLSGAYRKVLLLKNNSLDRLRSEQQTRNNGPPRTGGAKPPNQLSRATSIIRHRSVAGSGTARARAKVSELIVETNMDFITDALSEDIVLRLLLLKGDKEFVATRLSQREMLAHNMLMERMARQAVE